jgi:hypothetical protein
MHVFTLAFCMGESNKGRDIGVWCQARLDRLIVTVRNSEVVPTIKGYKVVRDTRIRRQGKIRTYQRGREWRSFRTGLRMFLQYDPLQGFLPDQRLTMVGDDELGITPKDIEDVIGVHFRSHRISLVEIPLDFPEDSGIDENFILRYGKFGKARRRKDRGGPGTLRYGSRSSPKLVRCYRKTPLGSYRLELELHSALLRKYSITNVGQLYAVASKLVSGHIRFVRIDWDKLEPVLRRRFGLDCPEILAEARRRANVSLRNATRYLGRRIPNVHRYLMPLLANQWARAALKTWADKFYQLEELFPVATSKLKNKPKGKK